MTPTLVALPDEVAEPARIAPPRPMLPSSTRSLGRNTPSEPRQWASLPGSLIQFFARPVVDKAVAVLACIPGGWFAYNCYRAGLMDIPRALFFAEMTLFVLSMVIRRNPVRITADPLYWLVAFLASYYGFFLPGLLRGGALIAPATACNALAVLGVWVAIFARFSLGRNIGLVPAQRKIVTGGAYRYVRHPIYTAHFVCSLGFALSCYSWFNALAVGVGCGLWVVKTFMEESFLGRDPEYAAYMQRVRWRWFPGIA